jgi:phage shock protein PspC (stress-responsive transcriptional regulator)
MTDSKKLYRSEDDKMLGGVCGGIAEVYNFDPSLVRLITLLLIFSGVTPFIYLIAWLIIPTESEVKDHRNVKDVEAEKVEDETEE